MEVQYSWNSTSNVLHSFSARLFADVNGTSLQFQDIRYNTSSNTTVIILAAALGAVGGLTLIALAFLVLVKLRRSSRRTIHSVSSDRVELTEDSWSVLYSARIFKMLDVPRCYLSWYLMPSNFHFNYSITGHSVTFIGTWAVVCRKIITIASQY